MSTEKLIRITSCINRKKGVSNEDFYKHWTQVHGPMWTDFMKRHGVVEYVQVRSVELTLAVSPFLSLRLPKPQFHITDETKSYGAAMAAAAGREML
jgi:hypothetical protein